MLKHINIGVLLREGHSLYKVFVLGAVKGFLLCNQYQVF